MLLKCSSRTRLTDISQYWLFKGNLGRNFIEVVEQKERCRTFFGCRNVVTQLHPSFFTDKDTHPSKSSPHQCSSCLNLVLYFPPDWLSPMREEYVAKITPFFTLPLCFEEIFPYLNWKRKWTKENETEPGRVGMCRSESAGERKSKTEPRWVGCNMSHQRQWVKC